MLSRTLLLSWLVASTAAAQLAPVPAGTLMPPSSPAAALVPPPGGGGPAPLADNIAVLPMAYANAFANTYSSSSNTPFASAPMQYQQVFLGSELPGGFPIRGMRLRRDDAQGRSNVGQTVDLEVNLGFTTMTPATLTSTFANNFDRAPPTNVFPRANFALPNMPSTLPTDPTVFFVQIPFTTPFIWPASGGGMNLLLEVINRGNSNNNTAFNYYLDVASGSSTFPVNTAKVYGTTTTGTVVRDNGLVIGLDGAGPAALHTNYGTGCPGTGGAAGTAVPAAFATSFGSGNNLIPFYYASCRYQQVFLASELPASTNPIIAVAMRQDEYYGGYPASTRDMEIWLGYTSLTPATLTTTFASNFDSGAPVNVVPRAMVPIPAMPLELPQDPSEFFFDIPFTTPFAWSPGKGNLLIEIVIHSSGSAAPLDFGTGNTARLWASSSTATTGSMDPNKNGGLAMFFRSPGPGPAIPWLTARGRPVIGATLDSSLRRARPSMPALLILGISDSLWGPIPLPFDLAILGAPGCSLRASPDLGIYGLATDAQGSLALSLPVPNVAGLAGAHLFQQFAVLDVSANALGLAFSRGADGLLGSF